MARCMWVLAILVFGTQLSIESAQTTGAVDMVAVPIPEQLKDATEKVNSLSQNLNVLRKNLKTASKYTEDAKTEVETMVGQAKGSVRNYKVYVTLAVNVANDVAKSNCTSGSSDQVKEVEENVSSKIDSSAEYYIRNFNDILNELNDIKQSLENKEAKDIVEVLNACVKNKTARQDEVSKCIQWNAAAYKELIVSASVKIAAAYNKALFLKKTTGLKVLRSSIDTSVSLSSNDIKNYAEEILECSGMSANAIVNTASDKFATVNSTSKAAVLKLISEVKDLIKKTQLKLNVTSTGAEPKLKELVADIEAAIAFILKHKPELAVELNLYRGRAQDIVSAGLNQLQSGLSQILSGLDQINKNLNNIYADFENKFAQFKKDLQACIPSKIEDRLTWTKSIIECSNKQLEVTVTFVNDTKEEIAKEKSKYLELDANADKRLDFNVEFSNVKPSVDMLIDEMLVKSGLSEEVLLAESQLRLTSSTKNNSDQLKTEVNALRNSIATAANGLSKELNKANDYKSSIDKLVNEASKFATKHAPSHLEQLNSLQNKSQLLVSKFKSDVEPVLNQLQSISINVGNVLNKLNELQEQVKSNLKSCLNNVNSNRFSNIDYIIACLQGYQNAADTLYSNAKQQFSVEVEKFDSLPDVKAAFKANTELQNILDKIDTIIEKIILEKNLSYDQLVERARAEIDSFNSSYGSNIKKDSSKLTGEITNAQNSVKVKISNAEELLSELVIYPIASTVRYSIDYAPDKAPELKTFYLHANELLNNYIAKIKSDALPYSIQFQSILDNVKTLYLTLQVQLENNKANLSACKEENGHGRIEKTEAVEECLNKLVNASEAVAKRIQNALLDNRDRFIASRNVSITVEVDTVKKSVDSTIQQVLGVAGLTKKRLGDSALLSLSNIRVKFATPVENGVNELKNSASNMQIQIQLEINNIADYITKVVNSISNTIKFAEKNSPKNVNVLKNYLNETDNLFTKIKTDLQPIDPKLTAIIEAIANISIKLNKQILESEEYIKECDQINIQNPLQNIQEVKACLDKQVNLSQSLAESTKLILSKEYDKYKAISNLASYVTGNLSSNLGVIVNGVKVKVDSIIEEEKLSPEVQLETNLHKLAAISVTAKDILTLGVDDLIANIVTTKDKLDNDLSRAELNFRAAIKPVSIAIAYATKYAPAKTPELNAFNSKADELVFGELLKIKTSVTPALTELDDILLDSKEILVALQNKIELANKSLSACPNINEPDKLVRIEAVKACLTTYMNGAVTDTEEAQSNLQNQIDRYNNVANTKLAIDLKPIAAKVSSIVDDVFTAAGLNDADILKKAQDELLSINTTRSVPLQISVDSLVTALEQIQNQIIQGINNTNVYLNNTKNIIKEATDFANKYEPGKVPQLNTFLNDVIQKANNAKLDFQVIQPQVQTILKIIGELVTNVQSQIKNISDNLNLCVKTNIVERVARAESVTQCVDRNLELARTELSKLENILVQEQEKYSNLSNIPVSISNNVSVSFNETINKVDKVVDEIIITAGLSPESLVNKGVRGLTSVYVTGNPQISTEDLQNAIIRYQKDIDAAVVQANQMLKELSTIDEVFDYTVKYAPEKTAELNALRAEKDKTIQAVIDNVKNTQQPIVDKLQLIYNTLEDNNIKFHADFKEIDNKLRACINVTIEDEIDKIEAIDACINEYLELAKTAVNNTQRVFSAQADAFNDLGNVNIKIDLNKVNAELKNLTNSAFEVAGLVPQVLLNNKLQELHKYNQTVTLNLQKDIANLSANIVQTQEELLTTLNAADKYLVDVVNNTSLAIDFATKYASGKIDDFQKFITDAQKLLLDAKTDIQPVRITLQTISQIINTIYNDLLTRLNQTQTNLLACPSSPTFDNLLALNTFLNCLNTNFEVSIIAGNVSKERLAEQIKVFDMVDNITVALNETLTSNFSAIDTSVIKKVDEVIVTYGLTAEGLKKKGLENIENVRAQVSSNLMLGISELEQSVNYTLNQIRTALNNGEKALNQSVGIIDNAIMYAAAYNPANKTELESFRIKENEIVDSIIQNITTNLSPVQNQLKKVVENKDVILTNFQEKIDEAKRSVAKCAEDETENRYVKIENIQTCINNNLNLLVDEVNKAQHSVYEKYEEYKSIRDIVVKVDTKAAATRAEEVVAEILKTAGLTGPQLQVKTSAEISSINASVASNLLDSINRLKSGVSATQNQTSLAVKYADKYLENTTRYIQDAKEFLQRHSSKRIPELEALLQKAQEIVVKVKSDIQPGEAQLLAIYNTAGLIYDNFQLQVDGTKASIKSCNENTNLNQLEQVQSIRNCLVSYVNTIISAANNANGQLNNEINKFDIVGEAAYNATVNIYPDFVAINAAVKEIINSEVSTNQLVPYELYQNATNNLQTYNTTFVDKIQSSVNNLKIAILNTNTDINNTIANIKVELNNAVKPIELAIQELIKYAPEKTAELVAYKARANDIITNAVSNVQANIQPTRTLLQSIQDSLDPIYNNVINQIDISKSKINFCYANQKQNELENIKYLEECFGKELKVISDISNNAVEKLNDEHNRYNGIGNITLYVTVDFGAINITTFNTVDDIRRISGLTPEGLLNSTKALLDVILANNGSAVRSDIISALNYVVSRQNDISSAAKNAEIQMKQEVQPIEAAINFAGKYAPERLAQLNNFLSSAQDLVVTNINKINSDILPSINALSKLKAELNTVVNNYDAEIATVKENLIKCISIENVNSYESIPVIQECLKNYVNQTNNAIKTAQDALSNLQQEFSKVSNTASYIVADIDLEQFARSVQDVITEIFENAGFTLPQLPDKLVTQLRDEFDFKVIDDKNKSVELTKQVVFIADKYVNSLDGTLDWSLEPIKLAIETIKYVNPNYNTSTLNNQWVNLHDQLRNIITNYIKSIEKNATDHNILAVGYNLTIEFALLRQNLDNCINSYKNTLPYMSDCIDPLVNEFNNNIYQALNKTKQIVDEIEDIKVTAPKLIEVFINKTAERMKLNATVIAEDGKTVAAIKPDEQITRFLSELDNLRKNGINVFVADINSLIKNVKNGNLTAFVDLNRKLDRAVEPWLYAINISAVNNPSRAAELITQLPTIQKIVADAKLRIKNELAPFIVDAIALENNLKAFQTSMNNNLTKFNAQLILSRCSSFNYSVTLFSDCIRNITADLYNYLTVVQPKLNDYLSSVNNITTSANGAIDQKISIEFNATQLLSLNEGGKVIQAYNISNNHILQQSLQNFNTYNITPIQHNARSIRSYSERLSARVQDMLVFANYTLRSSTYVINDAIGSIMYVIRWRKTFSAERDEGLRIATEAANKVLARAPNFTEDAIRLNMTADRINNTLEYEVSQLEPAQLSVTCPMTLDYYPMYQCLLKKVDLFGIYYKQALVESYREANIGFSIIANDSIQLSKWRDEVVYAETSTIVQLLKPYAQKLFTDNNIKIDQLLEYALYIINNKYKSFIPAIPNAADNLIAIANRILAKNYTGRVDLTEPANILLKPVINTLAYFQSVNLYHLLNETDLQLPHTLFNELNYKLYNIFYANFSIQANLAINLSALIQSDVQNTFNGLNYDFLLANCYDSELQYPLLELVNCYNTRHAAFAVFLSNSLKNLTQTASNLLNFDINEQKLVSDYVNNKLLVEFKHICAVTAIELYKKVGLAPPAEYVAMVTKQDLCRVGFITDKFTCIITQ